MFLAQPRKVSFACPERRPFGAGSIFSFLLALGRPWVPFICSFFLYWHKELVPLGQSLYLSFFFFFFLSYSFFFSFMYSSSVCLFVLFCMVDLSLTLFGLSIFLCYLVSLLRVLVNIWVLLTGSIASVCCTCFSLMFCCPNNNIFLLHFDIFVWSFCFPYFVYIFCCIGTLTNSC